MILAEQYSNNIIPMQVSLIVCEYDGKPAIEIRRVIKDVNLIKQILLAANYNRSVLVLPCFRDPLRARAALIEKGIIYEKNNECFFNI